MLWNNLDLNGKATLVRKKFKYLDKKYKDSYYLLIDSLIHTQSPTMRRTNYNNLTCKHDINQSHEKFAKKYFDSNSSVATSVNKCSVLKYFELMNYINIFSLPNSSFHCTSYLI